jgi:hypothetical protein
MLIPIEFATYALSKPFQFYEMAIQFAVQSLFQQNKCKMVFKFGNFQRYGQMEKI